MKRPESVPGWTVFAGTESRGSLGVIVMVGCDRVAEAAHSDGQVLADSFLPDQRSADLSAFWSLEGLVELIPGQDRQRALPALDFLVRRRSALWSAHLLCFPFFLSGMRARPGPLC